MRKKILQHLLLLCTSFSMTAPHVTLTGYQIKALTPDWTGERFHDGKPKVPDKLLERVNIFI